MAKRRKKSSKKNQVPLPVLEKRLTKLNTIVNRRGGKAFSGKAK